MKTVITASAPDVDSNMDPRFGRGAYFCLYNDENQQITFVKNKFKDAQGGAGTKVSEMILSMGVTRVISGDFGPKAKEMLDKFKVQLVKMQDDQKTIKDIISSLA